MTDLQILQYCLIAVPLFSVVSFLMYGWDKRQAKANGWRVPEKNLHLMSVLGGWPGAILGQRVFRHKTQKASFRMKLWATVVLNVIGIAYAVYGYMT